MVEKSSSNSNLANSVVVVGGTVVDEVAPVDSVWTVEVVLVTGLAVELV